MEQRKTSGPARTASELIARISWSIRTADENLSDLELIAVAHCSSLAGLPIALTVAGDRCGIVLARRVFDGTGSLQIIHELLDAASGGSLDAERS